jgi:tRNA(Ile)-lysidine synthase TilS/MesJ
MKQNYLKVGHYTPASNETEAIIEREFYGQGYIFKDEEAYNTGLNIPCYIPELSDAVYTHQSFLDMMDGQESLARNLFERVDWQHPETLLEEDFASGECDICPECGRMFACYDRAECLHCHKISCKEEREGE